METGPKVFAVFALIVAILAAMVSFATVDTGEQGTSPEPNKPKAQRVEEPKPPKGGGAPPPVDAKRGTGENKPAPEPEPKPNRDLYHRAHLKAATELPAYEVVSRSVNDTEFGKRVDAVVITEPTTDKEALGTIMVDMTLDDLSIDLLEVAFFESEIAVEQDTIFAYGTLAETAQGKAMITGEQVLSEVGKYPVLRITV